MACILLFNLFLKSSIHLKYKYEKTQKKIESYNMKNIVLQVD